MFTGSIYQVMSFKSYLLQLVSKLIMLDNHNWTNYFPEFMQSFYIVLCHFLILYLSIIQLLVPLLITKGRALPAYSGCILTSICTSISATLNCLYYLSCTHTKSCTAAMRKLAQIKKNTTRIYHTTHCL